MKLTCLNMILYIHIDLDICIDLYYDIFNILSLHTSIYETYLFQYDIINTYRLTHMYRFIL